MAWLPLAGAASGRSTPALTAAPRNQELLLLDPAVQDRAVLLAGLRPGIEAVLLKPDQDGLAQVAEALQGRSGLSAIHLVSHGAPGRIFLGNSVITRADLDRQRPRLERISAALAAGGSLLIYGCEVAQGEQGRAFLKDLAQATGAAVAAASGTIGAAGQGGGWALTERIGSVGTASAFSAAARAAYVPSLGNTPLTLDFTTGTWGLPADLGTGAFGGFGNFNNTYTQNGITWDLGNVMAGLDANSGAVDAHAFSPANGTNNYYNGTGYEVFTVTATLSAQGNPFYLEQLDLQWGQYAANPTLRIEGFYKNALVCTSNIPTPMNYAYATVGLGNGLGAFSGIRLDSLRITTNDQYNFRNIKIQLDTAITALAPLTPASGLANGGTVVYRATFGYGVAGLGTGNFDLNPTLSGASVVNVAAVAGTGRSVWDITVNTGTGDGPLGLRMVNSSNLNLPVTTSLPFADSAFTLDRTPPAITLSGPSVASTYTGPVTYTVTYSDANFSSSNLNTGQVGVNTTGTASVSNLTVTGTGLTRTITLAGLSGNGLISISLPAGTALDGAGNLAPAAGPSTAFTLSNLTSLALGSSLNPAAHGQPTTLTATITPAAATGSVTFMDGATVLGSAPLSGGSASYTTTALTVGSHLLTAVYAGSGFFTGSNSPGLPQSVTQAATTLTLGASPNPATLGQAVILSATGLPPDATGPVTFMDGATALGAGLVSAGSASFSTSALAVGSHSLTAVYGGDGNNHGSSSAALVQAVNPAATAATLASSANPATLGQSVTLTVSGFPTGPMGATGTVTFKDGAATLGTAALSGGSAAFSTTLLAVGSHTLSAVYSGDGSYLGATAGGLTQVIHPAGTTPTLGSSLNPASLGQAVTLTVSGLPAGASGTVTFKDGPTPLGSAPVSSGMAVFSSTLLTVGSHALTAAYGGDGQYAASVSAVLTQTVDKGAASVVLGGLSASYDGSAKAATATVTPANLPVTFTYGGAASVPVKAGSYPVVATVNSPSYQGTASGTLVIARATPALTWANPAAISLGTALGSAQLNAACAIPGTFAYAPGAGVVLPPGAGQGLSVTFTPADPDNYLTATQSVTIEVKTSTQTLTFAALPSCQLGDAPLPLSASASSGLPVTFSSSDPSVASVSGALLTIHATGSALITASQAGDAQYAPAASVTQPLRVAISPAAPQVTLATLPDGAVTSAPLLTVRGSAKSLNPLAWVLVNGAAASLNPDGSFLAALRLRSGANPITVVVADSVGLASTVNRTVNLDSTAPALTVTEPADGSTQAARDLLVQGSAGANLPAGAAADPVLAVTVAVNQGAEQSATLSGADFQLPVTLEDGWNSLTVTATSGAGRKTQVQRTLFTAAGGLTLAITDPPGDLLTTADSYLVKGMVAGANGLPVLTLTVAGQTFTPPVVAGTFQQWVPLAAPGTWPVTLAAVDPLQTTAQVGRVFTRSNVPAPGTYTLTDAEAAFRIAFGLASATPAGLLRFDLAPQLNGLPVGDGLIDVEDVLLIWAAATGHSF